MTPHLRSLSALAFVVATATCAPGCGDPEDDTVAVKGIDCDDLRAKLIRAQLSPLIAEGFETCVQPLSDPPQVPIELVPLIDRLSDQVDCLNRPNEFFVERGPPDGGVPGAPRTLILCEGGILSSCELFRSWVKGMLANDICNLPPEAN